MNQKRRPKRSSHAGSSKGPEQENHTMKWVFRAVLYGSLLLAGVFVMLHVTTRRNAESTVARWTELVKASKPLSEYESVVQGSPAASESAAAPSWVAGKDSQGVTWKIYTWSSLFANHRVALRVDGNVVDGVYPEAAKETDVIQ